MTDLLQQLKALDEQRAQLIDGAKKEALQKAQEAVDELNALGFAYHLTEGEVKRATRKGTRQIKDAECPVCKFKTAPPHDARKHRSQGENKRAFSQKQLEEMGLEKVA